MTDSNKKILATLLASLMMVSMVGAAFAPATAGASGPSGMLALGDAQVHEDIPEGADVPIGAADLEGAIYASDHADTLEAIVTTPERADEEYLDAGTIVTNDEVALVLRDDEVHDGREVAVELELLETALGFTPEVAYGVHESGEEWQSEIDKDGTVSAFDVPKFSDNTVTFTGAISLSGDAAGDGTTYEYDLDDLDGVDNFEIDVTGVESTAPESFTAVLDDGETKTETVGGTADPREETVTLEGREDTSSRYIWDDAESKTTEVIDVGGNMDPTDQSINVEANEETREPYSSSTRELDAINDPDETGTDSAYVYIEDPPDKIHGASVYVGVDGDAGAEISLTAYVEGHEFDSAGDHSFGSLSGELDEAIDVSDQDEVEIEISGGMRVNNPEPYLLIDEDSDGGSVSHDGFDFESVNSPARASVYDRADSAQVDAPGISENIDLSDGEEKTVTPDLSTGDETVDIDPEGGSVSYDIQFTEVTKTKDPEVAVGSSTVSHGGVLESGETVTESLDFSAGETEFDVSTDGEVAVSSSWTAVTETVDPVVEVNGHETSHDGTLADGEMTSLATNEAWLEEGTNTVTVSTNSPETGPESLTGFDYAHDASGATQSVEVEATSWTEAFNVSNTYPSATEDTSATLTFSDRVAEIDSVEYRLDGGEWESPPDYELNGTDLEVMIGDVEDDTTVDVRATGHKIQTYDGDVEIVEPTVEGDDLATEVEITDINPDGMFGLRVDGTELGDRIHYATEESWSGESAHVDVAPTGTQILRAPDANVGSTMTVRSSSLSVEPESGGMEVVVEDGDEPRFSVREGETVGTSTLDVTYHDTLPGERYVLWSATQDREIDADRASSPVYFTTDGDAETYTIRQIDREGSGGGAAPATSGAVAPLVLVLPAVGLSVTGLFWAGRRFGGARGVRGNGLLLVGSTVISAAALELVTPGSLIAQMWSATVFALGDAAASGLGAVVASIATLLGLWQIQTRTRADIPAWVLIPTVSLAGVLALESIRPGSVLGALEGVIAEIGALLALILVGFAIYRWRASNEAEAQPDTEVTFDLGDQGGDD